MTAFMTAAYMIRAWWMTFFGEYRGHGTPHESPAVMTVPLMILAAFSVVIGLVNIPAGSLNNFEKYVQPTYLFPKIEPIAFNWYTAIASVALGVLGAALSYWALGRSSRAVRRSARWSASAPLAWMHRAMENKYGLDVLYTDWIAGTVKGSMAAGANWFNRTIIGWCPTGPGSRRGRHQGAPSTATSTRTLLDGNDRRLGGGGRGLRSGPAIHMQTGKVQQYAALLFAGAALLAAIFVFVI